MQNDEQAEKSIIEAVRVLTEMHVQLNEVTVPTLNDILKGFFQIQWIGEFQQLCAGKSTYAKKVIRHFRESFEDENESVRVNDAPIVEEEINLFKDYLGDYGF
jgi:hypothetical protein